AYVVADAAGLRDVGGSGNAGIRDERAGEWKLLFDETYKSVETAEGPTFVGWNSSYTKAPIPEEEMQEWLAGTIERIAELAPSRVLEIGCGVGLLLRHFAPICEVYRGTDLSASAVAELQHWL